MKRNRLKNLLSGLKDYIESDQYSGSEEPIKLINSIKKKLNANSRNQKRKT